MFDLEKKMSDWKRDLLHGGDLDVDAVEELESHLRESYENLLGKGLEEEEAFLLALRRMGDKESLKEEFVKVGGLGRWSRRLGWMAIGYLVFAMSGKILGLVSGVTTLLGRPWVWMAMA